MSGVELPEQVRAGLAAAEAIEAEMALASAPPADPAAAAQPGEPAEPAPAPAPAAPAPEPPPPAPAPEPWEARYRTLQGMYDADVKSARTENATLRTQLADLQKEVDALKKAPAPAPAPGGPAPGLTAQDVEAFGEDLIEVINRVTDAKTAIFKSEIEDLRARTTTVSDNVDKVTKTHNEGSQAQFVDQLTQLVSDWQTVNTDPLFLSWCGQTNELTGRPNQELLEQAASAFDPRRVAAIFNNYKATLTAPLAPTPPPAADPSRRAELESQVAPGTAKSTAPAAAQPADRVFTTTEVEAFYRALSKGEYKGKEAEAAAIEAAIDQAVQSGRVR